MHTAMPHNPLAAAAQIQGMANKATDDRTAKLLTGLSIAVLALMLIREGRDFFMARPKDDRSWAEKVTDGRESQARAYAR